MRKEIDLKLIDDNPYNPRTYFHPGRIRELAASIKSIGLRQVPEARPVNGHYQLAYGHMRKRAYDKLNHDKPKDWLTMPLEIIKLTNEQMVLFSLEENLKRSDIRPIEVARCIDGYFTIFPDTKETHMAEKLNFSQGHISNMLRVLTLPKDILDKIDEGKITFTMGRELLILKGLKGTGRYVSGETDEVSLMKEAVRGVTGQYGGTCTVDGIKKAIHSTVNSHFNALDKGSYSYSDTALFDYTKAGCLKCEHMIRTNETKTQVRHHCTDNECFGKKQTAFKEKAATAATKKMTEDVLARVVETEAEREAGKDISQEITPIDEPGQVLSTEETVAIDAATIEAGDEEDRREKSLKTLPAEWPCHKCLNVRKCDRSTAVAKGDKMVCKNLVTEDSVEKLRKKATIKIPAKLQALVSAKAGSRAVILDLRELSIGGYSGELQDGYQNLEANVFDGYTNTGKLLDRIDDSEECLNRCTTGFHYAFDSRGSNPSVGYVCTDKKCLAKKKLAHTRKVNDAGNAKKRAERKAIKEAADDTLEIDKPRMKLILLAQMKGTHVENGQWSARAAMREWLYGKLDVKEDKEFVDALDKLKPVDLAKLVVEFMLRSLMFQGEISKYKIQTTEPLNWLGFSVNVKEKEKEAVK